MRMECVKRDSLLVVCCIVNRQMSRDRIKFELSHVCAFVETKSPKWFLSHIQLDDDLTPAYAQRSKK